MSQRTREAQHQPDHEHTDEHAHDARCIVGEEQVADTAGHPGEEEQDHPDDEEGEGDDQASDRPGPSADLELETLHPATLEAALFVMES